MNTVRVSVVVPAKNEEAHIRACLESLLNQTMPAEWYEVIVVDGNSDDETLSIIRDIQKTKKNLLMIENWAAITPVGMNLGIRSARGGVIIIAGAHATYPNHFLATSLEYLERTAADVVGGPINTVPSGEGIAAKLTAAILSSPFGVGSSKFRTGLEEGFVDTVPFGAFRREVFERVGMYNERLVRNQDNDLNARIRKAGGKIYLTPALTTQYRPVKSFRDLLKYAFRTSQWHIFTLRENRESLGFRHLAPSAFVVLLLLLLSASFLSRFALGILIAGLCVYFLAGFSLALSSKTKNSFAVTLILPFACFLYHNAYGVGTLSGLLYLFKPPSATPTRPRLPVQERLK